MLMVDIMFSPKMHIEPQKKVVELRQIKSSIIIIFYRLLIIVNFSCMTDYYFNFSYCSSMYGIYQFTDKINFYYVISFLG